VCSSPAPLASSAAPSSRNSCTLGTRCLAWPARTPPPRRLPQLAGRSTAAIWITWTVCGRARAADGVIHTAFNNVSATTDIATSVVANQRAIETMAEALAGSDRPLVFVSGTAGITPGRLVTEDDIPGARSVSLFGDTETAALAWAERGVRVATLRLPLSVHGDTDKRGFIPTLVNIARDKGVSGYVDDGANCWPAVHVRDAAALFRLVAESRLATPRVHAVDDEAVPMREIAETIGRHLNVPVTSIPAAEAEGHFGWFAPFASLHSPGSSELTRKRFEWTPDRPGLIADLNAGHYFTT